ncbi:universal stress protein [Halomicrococcus gelatinilyticus]|uniref:universal stress protein n=1 Tax=Halomicrococcus gelatinilyticus TaxID=1702103 RepID=UPI002E0D30B0
MSRSFDESVVVPVADAADAHATASALEPYDVESVTVVHVVEKGEGVPDKTPVEQSEAVAADAFEAFRETFPDAETATAYRRDVVAGIVEVAEELDASAIVFRPREGGRVVKFLSGDRSLRLLTEADRPVVALPGEDDG